MNITLGQRMSLISIFIVSNTKLLYNNTGTPNQGIPRYKIVNS